MNSNVFPFLIFAKAKRELREIGIEETPNILALTLMGGSQVPLFHQFILSKSVVEGEITKKEKEQALQNISALTKNRDDAEEALTALQTDIKAQIDKVFQDKIDKFQNATAEEKKKIKADTQGFVNLFGQFDIASELKKIANEVLQEKDNGIQAILKSG